MSALAEALVAAQAELPCTLGKDADGDGYRYLTLDKLIAETRPILTRHGLAIIQAPSCITHESHALPALVTRLQHAETDEAVRGGTLQHGDYLEFVMPLYLPAKTMQGYGAAITYARRYAWQSMLGVAAEEDTDAPEVPF